jgi:hypothetical protein
MNTASFLYVVGASIGEEPLWMASFYEGFFGRALPV